MKETMYTVTEDTGFAQLATLCVHLTRSYASDISVKYRGRVLPVQRSHEGIMKVMDLGIQWGDAFSIRAEGVDEFMAIQEMNEHLLASGKLVVKHG